MIAPKGSPPPDEKTALRRARVNALVLASLTIVSLLFMVYAFIQKAESENNRMRALEQEELYNICQQELQRATQAAEEMQQAAAVERIRAEENYQRALLEIEKAKSNRK
jgi:hypothetical protein